MRTQLEIEPIAPCESVAPTPDELAQLEELCASPEELDALLNEAARAEALAQYAHEESLPAVERLTDEELDFVMSVMERCQREGRVPSWVRAQQDREQARRELRELTRARTPDERRDARSAQAARTAIAPIVDAIPSLELHEADSCLLIDKGSLSDGLRREHLRASLLRCMANVPSIRNLAYMRAVKLLTGSTLHRWIGQRAIHVRGEKTDKSLSPSRARAQTVGEGRLLDMTYQQASDIAEDIAQSVMVRAWEIITLGESATLRDVYQRYYLANQDQPVTDRSDSARTTVTVWESNTREAIQLHERYRYARPSSRTIKSDTGMYMWLLGLVSGQVANWFSSTRRQRTDSYLYQTADGELADIRESLMADIVTSDGDTVTASVESIGACAWWLNTLTEAQRHYSLWRLAGHNDSSYMDRFGFSAGRLDRLKASVMHAYFERLADQAANELVSESLDAVFRLEAEHVNWSRLQRNRPDNHAARTRVDRLAELADVYADRQAKLEARKQRERERQAARRAAQTDAQREQAREQARKRMQARRAQAHEQ